MQSKFLKLAVGFSATAAAALYGASAVQAHEYRHHHHHYRAAYDDRPLTVTKHHRYYAPVAAAPDPWHGPAPIITGPNYIAATAVSLPFRAVNTVFPPYGDPATNPLVFIGAPVHVIAQAAEFPFYVVGSAFGAPPPVAY